MLDKNVTFLPEIQANLEQKLGEGRSHIRNLSVTFMSARKYVDAVKKYSPEKV
jgi:hypothetical protein